MLLKTNACVLQYGEPEKICVECVERLRIAYNFRETVLLSQQALKDQREDSAEEDSTKEDGSPHEIDETIALPIKTEDGADDEKDTLARLCADLDLETESNSAKQPKNKSNKQECEFCSLELPNKRLLKKHISQFHKAEKLYTCTMCQRDFKQAFHLREHLASHTGEKNYSCEQCGKTFQRMSSRSRHMKTHDKAPGQKTKRTPFLCTICGRSFPFSNSVQRHMRVHLGIRRHECNVCHKRFNQSTHLRVHMRTHTGEKPYVCDLCGNAFSLNATLRKHLMTHKLKDRERAQCKFEVEGV